MKEYFPSCMDFFTSIKKIGANKAQSNQDKSDPRFIHKVIQHYENTYIEDREVFATYHLLYLSYNPN